MYGEMMRHDELLFDSFLGKDDEEVTPEGSGLDNPLSVVFAVSIANGLSSS